MEGGEEVLASVASQGAQGSGSKMAGGANTSTDESENWVTAEGYYENGKIIAKIPHLVNFDPDQL